MQKAYATFTLVQSQEIPALKITLEEYEHTATGAKHYHLASNNPENVCMAAVRTLPMNDMGTPHILEHTALCGSEKYPVRDPFFTMLRRSNNTFMNAFTSSDWTAYPFASETPKDFDNLMSVYLDATFFSNLEELNFRQEGWRLDFEKEGDITSPLVYKGVVFNEMKGAMSSSDRRVAQNMDTALYTSTTYHYNSGGEPKNIPDLSYAELLAFREKYYHPSNTMFMTYGDKPAYELQQKFEEFVLHRFERSPHKIEVTPEERFSAPKQSKTRFAVGELDASGKNDYVTMGWLVGDTTNVVEKLRLQLLDMVLMHDSASPLLKVLESTPLGKSPFKYSGLGTEARDISYVVGLEGVDSAKDASAVEELILTTLEKVAKEGVSKKRLDALLHQLEIDSRNLEGGGYPLGLRLCLQGLAHAVHRADVLSAYDLESGIETLRKEIEDPEFIQKLVQEKLLSNPHRVTQVSVADETLAKAEEEAEKTRLAEIKARILKEEREAGLIKIAEMNKQLKDMQDADEDISCLPKIELSDLRPDVRSAPSVQMEVGGRKVSLFDQPTNGLVYLSLVMDMPKLSEHEEFLMPLYAGILDELGFADKSYEEVAEIQTEVSSTVHGGSHTRSKLGDPSTLQAYFSISGSGLMRNKEKIADLMVNMLTSVRFDELSRIQEFLQQVLSARLVSSVNNGHLSAMVAARSSLAAESYLSSKQGGLQSVAFLKKLVSDIEDPEKLKGLAAELQSIHDKLKKAPVQLRLTGEMAEIEPFAQQFAEMLPENDTKNAFMFYETTAPQGTGKGYLWVVNTQVNYCAKAYKCADISHKDAPALHVLSQLMRDGFLHTAVREQGGAYGGGSSYHGDTGTFAFFSYRDPRVKGTLEDFDKAIDWSLNHKHKESALEEAILGLVSSMDSPQTPAALASSTFWGELYGRDQAFRAAYRQGLLNVTLEDVRRVAQTYFKKEEGVVAVLTSKDFVEKEALNALDLEVCQL